jgi:ankyrin repeat protein
VYVDLTNASSVKEEGAMKKILVPVLFVFLLLAALPGCSAEAAMSVGDFFELCDEGTSEEVIAATNGGADVNARNPDDLRGFTPLMQVAEAWVKKSPEAFIALIQAGADVNAKDRDGRTPLMHAARLYDDPDVLSVLIDAGADVNAKSGNGMTPLMYAVTDYTSYGDRNANPEILRLLIRVGADVNAKDNDGNTALMIAACDGAEVLNVLIRAGANVDVKSDSDFRKGYTPLMWAAQWSDNPEALKALIDAGADVNATDNDGATPLMWAAYETMWGDGEPRANNNGFLGILIQAGADINAKDKNGRTALSFAAENNKPEIASILLAAGATVSDSDVELALANELLKGHAVIEDMKSKVR